MHQACHPEEAYFTVKTPVLVIVPPTNVVTLIRPVVAPAGTSTVMVVEESVFMTPAVPLKLTTVTPENLDPPIVTSFPTFALVGEKLMILGLPLLL
jgi:hypothetical protein